MRKRGDLVTGATGWGCQRGCAPLAPPPLGGVLLPLALRLTPHVLRRAKLVPVPALVSTRSYDPIIKGWVGGGRAWDS